MFTLAQVPTPQLPPLPDGPSLDRVRGPIELPAYSNWQITLFALASLLLLVLFIWAGARLYRYFRQRRAALAPAQVAQAELRSAELCQADERFAVCLTQALRRYFEQGLHLPSHAQTSEEFLRRLKHHPHLSTDFQNELAEFLRHCDRVKFARTQMDSLQRSKLIQQAHNLVEQAEAVKEEVQT